MITFNQEKEDEIAIFYFKKIPDFFHKYCYIVNQFFTDLEVKGISYIEDLKKNIKDDCFENVVKIELINVLTKICSKDENKKLAEEILTQKIKEEITNKKSRLFLDILLPKKINKEEKLREDRGIYESISLSNAKDVFLFLSLYEENDFDLKNKKISAKNLETIYACIDINSHSHTSKFVHSSAELTCLELEKNDEFKEIGINSKTIDIGLPFSLSEGSGVGRDNTTLLNSLRQIYNVNGENISLLQIYQTIRRGGNELGDLESYMESNFDESFKFIPIKNDKNESMLHLSQLLYYVEEKWLNLIPVPSVKMMSSLFVINEDSKVIIEKLGKKEVKNRFWFVKSVASNPQNISIFAGSKGALFPRMLNLPHLQKLKTREEKHFYVLQHVLKRDAIKNTDKQLSGFAYIKLIEDRNAQLALPNKLVKKMRNDFCRKLAEKICYKISNCKKGIQLLQKDEEFIKKLAQDKQLRTLQKFMLSLELSESEIELLLDYSILLYEDSMALSLEDKEILKIDVKEILCI